MSWSLALRKLEYILRRLMLSIIVLLGLTIITFTLSRIIPSDPASLYLGPRARPDELERVRIELGLNQPLLMQYLTYMGALMNGDLGNSIATKRPILQELTDRLPATLELLFAAMLLAVVIGIPLGVASAKLRGKPLDLGVRTLSIIGVSMPAFWLGLLLQLIIAHGLGLLPIAGRIDRAMRFSSPITEITGFYVFDTIASGNWVAFRDAVAHLGLPAITLAAYPVGLIARMTRATMMEVLEQPYIRTARAFGIQERIITYQYALRNAFAPILTVIGLTLAYLLTGAFFVEIIFNWPGLGMFTARSFLNLDYPAIMGMTLFSASGYVLINLLVDLLQTWVDPRIALR